MSPEPVPADPGRDDDPARGALAPDPVSAAEREAWLDHLVALDDPCEPEEWPDPQDCVPLPGEDALTAEELAEIAEAVRDQAAAEAGTVAEMARLGGSLGMIAAAAVRRGPGQPGSARVPAGESCSRAAAFGPGMALDVMPGGPGLAVPRMRRRARMTVSRVSDAELAGVMCAWERVGRTPPGGSWPRSRS